jgi:SMC interacting uncharacterized protein involved in chromosome segregation
MSWCAFERCFGEIRQDVHSLTDDLREVRERLVRPAASREADRAQAAAELAQFKAEVERAEVRLSRMLPSKQPKPKS